MPAHLPLVAILSLGIGIGSATAIFSLLNTVLLKPLTYRQPNQLVDLREVVAPLRATYPSLPVNYQHFAFWRDHARSFEMLAALSGGAANLTDGEPIPVDTAEVSTNLFQLLGVQPQLGRSFLPEEGRKGHDAVAILTYSLWSRRFGRRPDVLGKTINISYRPYTTVGVLPAKFHFPKNGDLGPLVSFGKNTELFFPLTGSYSNGWGGDYDYTVFGRLKPDISIKQAVAEIDLLERQIDLEHRLHEGLTVSAVRLRDVIATPLRAPLYILMAAVTLLLLIVCGNLANLVLARSSARVREFSIRAALGAGQVHLMRQLLAETLLLAITGGALGLALAILFVHIFVSQTAVSIPRLDEVRVDGRAFLFALLVTFGCGLLSGLLPAWRMARVDTQEALRANSQSIAGNRQSLRLREFLIACEVAFSVVLLFGAGLLTVSLAKLLASDKGFTVEQAVGIDISLPDVHYKTSQQNLRFWETALDKLRLLPGVRSAAYTSKLPLTGESMVNDIQLEGSDKAALDPVSRADIEVNVRYVSPDYFRTLGIPLVAGRAIERSDRNRAVSVVSARLAAKLWPNQNPLGKEFSTGADVGRVQVVGIVKDVHATTLDKEPTLMVYVPYWHRGLGYGTVAVRTAVDPASLIPAIRKCILEIDPALPVPETTTVAKLVSDSLSRRAFQVQLASGFAAAALFLALIGIYGVVAYSASQRRTEVAVRLALGASRADVFLLMLRGGFRPVVFGLALGLLAALASAQLLRSVLFGVTATDPLTLFAVIMLLATAALCACLLPARRAVRIDPAIALRYE